MLLCDKWDEASPAVKKRQELKPDMQCKVWKPKFKKQSN